MIIFLFITEYLLDQDNSTDIITPWKPEENDKVTQIPSKRKQTLPTRITKSGDRPGTLGPAAQIYGGMPTSQRGGKSDWISGSELKGNMKQKHSHIPSYREKNADGMLGQQSYVNASDFNSQRNATFGGKTTAENMYGRLQSSALSHDQILNLSAENMTNSGLHSDKFVENSGSAKGLDICGSSKGLDLSWQEEGFSPGGVKSYMKTPQIDGLFVSRGEGRFEKLIKCEECGKVCRTSNMARHKKRYCTALPKVSRTKKSFCRTNDYISVIDMPLEGSGSGIYLDNAERDDFSKEIPDSAKNVDSVKALRQPSADEVAISDICSAASRAKLTLSPHIGKKGKLGPLMPEQNQDIQASARISNMAFSNSPPSTKLMQDKTKMQAKGANSTHLIGTFHEGADTGIRSSDFDSAVGISFSGKNKSEGILTHLITADEFSTAESDVTYDKNVKSDKAEESCTGGSRKEAVAEEMTTDERKFMHKENHSVDSSKLNPTVKKEPASFGNV